ncbi:CAP domain-containing protein [Candidatus Nomurabacteria bacterium]|jgi:uncharacterized protein YkwD|nr:MAG: CAP domain-containing protein [Candidatus Nomurabacteria bacterium]
MLPRLKNFFISHEGNAYHPHLLREVSLVVIGIAAILLCITSFGNSLILTTTKQGAEVIASVLVDLTNIDRSLDNKPTLTIDPLLTKAANLKIDDMIAKNYFAHTSPQGVTPWYWFDVAGYRFRYAGENLAVNFANSGDIEHAWMNSISHRDNLLNENFTDIGIAVKEGMYQGAKSIFVVELFGKPLPAKTLTTPSVLVDTTVKPSPSVTDEVAVASAIKGATTERDSIVAISETPTTIIVENIGQESAVDDTNSTTTRYATWFAHIQSTYPNIIQDIYLVTMIVLTVTLLGTMYVEVRAHNVRKIFLTVGVICLLLVLFYINKSFVVFV